MENELFAIATREKYRFPFRGQITVEDLWDLTPAQLDSVYKTLNKTATAQTEESLLAENAVDTTTANMIEIVKHIFGVKKQEAEERKTAAEKSEKRKHILEILAKKQDDALQNKSEDELKKLLEEL